MVDRGNDHAHTSQCNARASGFSEWRFLYRHNDVFGPKSSRVATSTITYYSTLRTLSSKGPLLSQAAVDTNERQWLIKRKARDTTDIESILSLIFEPVLAQHIFQSSQ